MHAPVTWSQRCCRAAASRARAGRHGKRSVAASTQQPGGSRITSLRVPEHSCGCGSSARATGSERLPSFRPRTPRVLLAVLHSATRPIFSPVSHQCRPRTLVFPWPARTRPLHPCSVRDAATGPSLTTCWQCERGAAPLDRPRRSQLPAAWRTCETSWAWLVRALQRAMRPSPRPRRLVCGPRA